MCAALKMPKLVAFMQEQPARRWQSSPCHIMTERAYGDNANDVWVA